MTLYLIDAHPQTIEPIPLTVEEFDEGIFVVENEIAARYGCSVRDIDAFPITFAGVQYDTSIDGDAFDCVSYTE